MASIRVKKDTTDDSVGSRWQRDAPCSGSTISCFNLELSGYMFIGFIGLMWPMGYSSNFWPSIISTIGQLVAWIWLYKYIQKEGNERNVRSLSSLVASSRRRTLKQKRQRFVQSHSC